ncbi:hypothetical protein ABT095_14375 [Kitasatospora sp. NPDC002227]|uniref:hypothetical protein n=1 Tax=Kitasatospora sp. NPDC002227 TaxID=3154773 RepID=UPI0033271CF7
MARTTVRVFHCDWPGCQTVLVVPVADLDAARHYAWQRGWMWTPGAAEQHFCGTWVDGRRVGHSRRMLDEHTPTLHLLSWPSRGFFVSCGCGWSASGVLEPTAWTPGEARSSWSGHLTTAA